MYVYISAEQIRCTPSPQWRSVGCAQGPDPGAYLPRSNDRRTKAQMIRHSHMSMPLWLYREGWKNYIYYKDGPSLPTKFFD